MLEAVLVLAAAVANACRPRRALLAENALLRHQLAVLQRSVTRPRVTWFDRIVLVALAAVTPTWRNVLRIVQPETLLRWHRAGFRALWRWRSRTQPASRVAAETAALIRRRPRRTDSGAPSGSEESCSSSASRSASARSRGTCGRRGPPNREGSAGPAFLRNHAQEIWACDFLQAYDVFFRSIFAFVFIELATHKVVLAATTRFPS
jgi:putative transposase